MTTGDMITEAPWDGDNTIEWIAGCEYETVNHSVVCGHSRGVEKDGRKMTIIEKINKLESEYIFELNQWEQRFIRNMKVALLGCPAGMPDKQLDAWLSYNQIEKIQQVWEKYGHSTDYGF